MDNTRPKITRLGPDLFSLDWTFGIVPDLHAKMLVLADELRAHYKSHLVDIVMGYQSALVSFSEGFVHDKTVDELEKLDLSHFEKQRSSSNRWLIPVYYDNSVGNDLELLANEKKMSTAELIVLHSSVHYRVYFTGFLPGFPYLGGLPKSLHAARKKTPALIIEAGSVGIGGEQTGIYPVNSPGGWHIIGKTPITLFDSSKTNPIFFKAGDELKFIPIDKKTFNGIIADVENGQYTLQNELIDD